MKEILGYIFFKVPQLTSLKIEGRRGYVFIFETNEVEWPRPGTNFDYVSEFNSLYIESDLKETEVDLIYESLQKIKTLFPRQVFNRADFI